MPRFLRQLLFRYKLLHLLVLLLFSLLLQYLYDDEEMQFWPELAAWYSVVLLCTAAAWLAAGRLVRAYLYQKRTAAFVGWLLLIALLNSILTYIVSGALYIYLADDGPLFTGPGYFLYMVGFFFIANVGVISVVCGLRILTDRYRMEDRLARIEQDKITTELAFLRSQTNPHFLFNVLNTIYFQIKADNTPARDSVEKLAEILRYQLYECNTDLISIEKEMANIRNYVILQQLRMEAGTKVELNISPDLSHFKIAPLLILPLVENAFKHLSHFKIAENNQLLIHLYHQNEGIFVAEISNTCDEQAKTTHLIASGGVGLPNLRRRLALLYPDKHELHTGREGLVYTTKLQIAYDDSMFTGGRRTHSAERLAGVHTAD